MHRRLVTFDGAKRNYGVVVNADFSVDEDATKTLRSKMSQQQKLTNGESEGGESQGGDDVGYDRGGSMSQLIAQCREETGLDAPTPQWEKDPYGPHTGLPYVKEWYKKMREEGFRAWDRI